MPSQLRFEGPDLEDVLEEVYESYGREVSIAEANKVRKGGFGGFFAKEVYEVVVDLDADGETLTLPDATPTPRSAARSVLDLADAVDDDEMASPETVADLVRRTGDDGIEELLRASGIDRDAAMRSASSEVADADAPRRSSRTMSAAELFASTKPASSKPQGLPVEHLPGAGGTRMSSDGEGFADVMDRIARQATAEPEPAEPDAPFVRFGDDRVEEPAPEPRRPARIIRSRRSTAVEVPDNDDRGPRTIAPPALPFQTADLVSLGMPMQYLRDELSSTEQLSALLELTSKLPLAPELPRSGDAVIALIGDRRGLVEVSNHVNELLGLNPERMMVATRKENSTIPTNRRLDSVEAAATQRRNWRRRDQPTVVIIDEPVSRARTAWSRHILETLEPAATWGVVEAQRKPEDVEDWVARLGGVEALAVYGTDETTSPASILTTGIPISLLDGRAATAARWAAVLDERLYAA